MDDKEIKVHPSRLSPEAQANLQSLIDGREERDAAFWANLDKERDFAFSLEVRGHKFNFYRIVDAYDPTREAFFLFLVGPDENWWRELAEGEEVFAGFVRTRLTRQQAVIDAEEWLDFQDECDSEEN